jgi:FSR family fosmidomycin resistance protein-like MFS transporter
MGSNDQPAAASPAPLEGTVLKVLLALSASHMINDTLQSLLPAIYPLLKANYSLTFAQIGLITLSFQGVASLLQPLVGTYTDRQPKPYSLAFGMSLTLVGLVLLASATHYAFILVAAGLIGIGSSIFHPEASRVAHMAAGGRHGFAQSLFQVGGNFGSCLGPMAAALIIVPRGQTTLLWFTLLAAVGIVVLLKIGGWYQRNLAQHLERARARQRTGGPALPRRRIILSLAILFTLLFSKYVYLVSLTNYYTFYLIHRFHVTVKTSLLLLFVFLFAVAAGTLMGGPLGDRFGRKYVIWLSILGVAPFSLLMPHVGLTATVILSGLIGLILASAFSAILVYAQELVPGRVGTIAGVFFGFNFGVSAIAAFALGKLADHTSIEYVFFLCGFLPLIGLLTGFLPNIEARRPTPA